jgi:hypothetical protein
MIHKTYRCHQKSENKLCKLQIRTSRAKQCAAAYIRSGHRDVTLKGLVVFIFAGDVNYCHMI